VSKLIKTIFDNSETRLTEVDILTIDLTEDGTFMVQTRDDACELTFDELENMHKAIGLEIVRCKAQLK
jgi:uncharacterized protein YqfB (UPF0267 family)